MEKGITNLDNFIKKKKKRRIKIFRLRSFRFFLLNDESSFIFITKRYSS